MEILKNLSEDELDTLRIKFKDDQGGIGEEDFCRLLLDACRNKMLAFRVTKMFLRKIFANVDVVGTGKVTWADFTMFVIEQAQTSEVGEAAGPVRGVTLSKLTHLERVDAKNTPANQQSSSTEARKNVPQPSSASPPDAAGTAPSASSAAAAGSAASPKRPGDSSEGSAAASSPSSAPVRSDGGGGGDDTSSGAPADERVQLVFAVDEGEDEGRSEFRPYHVDVRVPNSYTTTTRSLRYLPRVQKMAKLVETVKGSQLTLYEADEEGLPTFGKVPKVADHITAYDFIPVTGGISNSNTIACAYDGGLLQLFQLTKKSLLDENLIVSASVQLSETQTAVRWSPVFNRLLAGSRGGVVTVWDVDHKGIFAQEKLHSGQISAMQLRSGTLFTASVDRFNSVKAVDLEKSVVQNVYSDHMIGGALQLEIDDEFLFSSGLEGKIVQRPHRHPKANPAFLYDSQHPHNGRITCLYRVPGSNILASGDAKGLVKLWDLRTGSCVQSITPTVVSQEVTSKVVTRRANNNNSIGAAGAGGSSGLPGLSSGRGGGGGGGFAADEAAADTCPINTICQVPQKAMLLVGNPREMVVLSAEDNSSPQCVDDVRPCRFVLIPNPDQVLTIHESDVKLWNVNSGYMVYSTDEALLDADVSACTLVTPLNRVFLLASMSGEIKGFSVALARQTFNFVPALATADLMDREVLSLHVLEKFRDYSWPYLIASYADRICLFPMSEDFAASSVTRLHVIASVLQEGRYKVRESRLQQNQLFVLCTNSYVYIIDLSHVGVITGSYSVPQVGIENILTAPVTTLPVTASVAASGSPVTCTLTKKTDGGSGADGTPPLKPKRAKQSTGAADQEGNNADAKDSAKEEEGKSPATVPTLPLLPLQPPNARRAGGGGCGGGGGTVTVDDPEVSPTRREKERKSEHGAATGGHPTIFTLLLLGDSIGHITVGEACSFARDDGSGRRSGGAAGAPAPGDNTFTLLGEWNGSRKEGTWRWNRGRRHHNRATHGNKTANSTIGGGGTSLNNSIANTGAATNNGGGGAAGQPATASPATNLTLEDTAVFTRTSSFFALPNGGNPIGEDGLPVLLPNAGSVVTHMHYYSNLNVLATGDERGDIRLWDMQGVVQASSSVSGATAAGNTSVSPRPVTTSGGARGQGPPAGSYPPVQIADWHAHDKGLTAMAGMLHGTFQLPIVVTAGADRMVFFWSADGVVLGTLAMGRHTDDLSGGVRYKLDPFRLAQSSAELQTDGWAQFLEYLETRNRAVEKVLSDEAARGGGGGDTGTVGRKPRAASMLNKERSRIQVSSGAENPDATISLPPDPAADTKDATDPFFVTETNAGVGASGTQLDKEGQDLAAKRNSNGGSKNDAAADDDDDDELLGTTTRRLGLEQTNAPAQGVGRSGSFLFSAAPDTDDILRQAAASITQISSSDSESSGDGASDAGDMDHRIVKPMFARNATRPRPVRLARTGVSQQPLPLQVQSKPPPRASSVPPLPLPSPVSGTSKKSSSAGIAPESARTDRSQSRHKSRRSVPRASPGTTPGTSARSTKTNRSGGVGGGGGDGGSGGGNGNSARNENAENTMRQATRRLLPTLN